MKYVGSTGGWRIAKHTPACAGYATISRSDSQQYTSKRVLDVLAKEAMNYAL